MTSKYIMAIQVVPFTKAGPNNTLIDKAIDAIRKSGVKHQVGPCETVMEGTGDQLNKALEDAQQACFDAGADELMVNVKIERSRDRDMTIERAIGKYVAWNKNG